MIDRRRLRRILGSRAARKAGTKTQSIPGTGGPNQWQLDKYRNYRTPPRPHPRTRLAELIRAREEVNE